MIVFRLVTFRAPTFIRGYVPSGFMSQPRKDQSSVGRPTGESNAVHGREHPGLRLCQIVREAHRFAHHYHHILRLRKRPGE